MFKKIICAILIALMLVTVFAACRGDQTDTGENGDGGETDGGENGGGTGEGEGDGTGGEDAGDPVDPENPQGLEFQLKDDGTYAVGIGKANGLAKVEIPATYKDKPVTELIKFAVTTANGTSNTSMKELVIPDSITSVRTDAFSGCTTLTSVYISDLTAWCSINFANSYANPLAYAKEFYVNGELTTELVIPEGTVAIKDFAFYGCNTAVSVVIADSVETIGKNAFYNCTSMVSFEMGTGVTSIAESVFTNCQALTTVNVKDLARWCSISFANNVSNPTSYSQKLYVNGELLTSLVIPDSVVFVNPRAFYNCKSLTSVTVPAGVQGIGESAFLNCDKLVEVINLSLLDITVGSTSNGNVAGYAKLVHYEDSLIENVDGYLFFAHEGTGYLLTYIGEDTELVLPENYKGKGYNIYSNAFYGNKELTSVVIPDCVTVIHNNAFYNCKNMTALTLGEGIVTIENEAFAFCNALLNLTIPDSVTTIGERAFVSCLKLETLNIGNGLTNVGATAFSNCPKTVKFNISDFESWCKISFADYGANPLYSAGRIYVNGEILTEVIIPESVKSVGANAFIGCKDIVRVVLHDEVTSVGDFAFYGCLNLVSVELGAGMTTIGNAAFDSCVRLAEVINRSEMEIVKGTEDNGKIALNAIAVHNEESRIEIIDGYLFFIADDTVGLLGYSGTDTELVFPESCNGKSYLVYNQAFIGCETITSVVLSRGVTAVNPSAFSYCSALKSITIPDTVTYFGADAFYASDALEFVHITDIGKWCTTTFANSYANPVDWAKKLYLNGELVTSLVVPEDVTAINGYAFHSCGSLTSITLHENVTSIGHNAFLYCYKLAEVINHSSLNLKAGDGKLGCVSYYAKEVHTGASKVDAVGDYLFYSYNGVNYLLYYAGTDTELVLPESYKGQNYVVNDYAFLYFKNITSVVIPDSVTVLGMNAFRFCTALESVQLGSGLTNIKSGAFYGCSALSNMTVKVTSGWKVDKESIPSAHLADPLKAADLFKVLYPSSEWKRS